MYLTVLVLQRDWKVTCLKRNHVTFIHTALFNRSYIMCVEDTYLFCNFPLYCSRCASAVEQNWQMRREELGTLLVWEIYCAWVTCSIEQQEPLMNHYFLSSQGYKLFFFCRMAESSGNSTMLFRHPCCYPLLSVDSLTLQTALSSLWRPWHPMLRHTWN